MDGSHCAASTNIGGKVTVLDSKWMDHRLSSSLTHQLALIYRVFIENDEDGEMSLPVYVPSLQQQKGTNDCGVFAIAFAYYMASGDNVEIIEFDQGKMRNHLSDCFKNSKLLPFPQLKECGPRELHRFPFTCVDIFCQCKMPETYGNMIQCDNCDLWYYTKCVIQHSISTSTKWYCKECTN